MELEFSFRFRNNEISCRAWVEWGEEASEFEQQISSKSFNFIPKLLFFSFRFKFRITQLNIW